MLTRRNNSKGGVTAVELVIVTVLFAILVAIVLDVADGRRRLGLRQESTDILVVVHSAFSMYGPNLPPLSTVHGHLAPSERSLPSVVGASFGFGSRSVTIPEAQSRYGLWTSMTDDRFWYLGYALPNEKAGLAFVEAYKKAVRNTGKPPLGDIEVGSPVLIPESKENMPMPMKVSTLSPLGQWMPNPLSSGTGMSFLPDKGGADGYEAFVQGEGGSIPLTAIPILIERPGIHERGSNVLFLDGTIRFMKYPGKWPMTEKFITALESLDELKESRADKAKI